MKRKVESTFFEGDDSFSKESHIDFLNVSFYPGGSAFLSSENITFNECTFFTSESFWNCSHLDFTDSVMHGLAKNSIWNSKYISMQNIHVHSPDVLRSIYKLNIKNISFSEAKNCIWYCSEFTIEYADLLNSDFAFKNCMQGTVCELRIEGKFPFYNATDIVIRNAYISSHYAFWGSNNITVYDSVIEGECIGWYSNKLKLINCTIVGERALCFCEELIIDNCIMNNANGCFEFSTLVAKIDGVINEIVNPRDALVIADSISKIEYSGHSEDQNDNLIIETCKPGTLDDLISVPSKLFMRGR